MPINLINGGNMFTIIRTVFVFCAFLASCCYGEIYTSMAEMEDLLEHVRQNIDRDITMLKHLPRKDKIRLRRNAYDMEQLSDVILHPNFTVQHPINAYTFLLNVTSAYDTKVRDVILANGTDLRKRIFARLTFGDDVTSIRMAILRIQQTYDLKAEDILLGNINGINTAHIINDCFQFVYAARKFSSTSQLSDEWMHACLNATGTDSTSTVSLNYVKQEAAELEEKNEFRDAARIYARIVEVEPGRHKDKLRYLRRMIPRRGAAPVTTATQKHPLVETQDKLCQGMDLKTPAERQSKQLVCRLVHDHPLLKLQPGRAELRSRDPHIVIYHNFLSKTEMGNIKNAAKRRMMRATVSHPKGAKDVRSPLRTCKHAFVDMTGPPFTTTHKIEALTGLKTGPFLSADSQIANYGVGGHYFIHSDDYGPDNRRLDERMATFMFYLSDVESGGATVFLGPKETVYPEEGAAVFWYNTYQNGTVNRNTQHAACPVAVGNKWIGTYWIHMNRQEFTKPCNLKKNHRYWPFP